MPRARRSRASSRKGAHSEDEELATAPPPAGETGAGEGVRWRALALAVPAMTALVVTIITVAGPHLWGDGTQQAAGGVVTRAPAPAAGGADAAQPKVSPGGTARGKVKAESASLVQGARGDALVLTVATTTFTPTRAGGFRISVHGSARALRHGEAVIAIAKVGASKRNWIVSGAVKPDAAGRWHAVITIGHRVVGTMTVTAVCVGLPTAVTTHTEQSTALTTPLPSQPGPVPPRSGAGPTPTSSPSVHRHAYQVPKPGEGGVSGEISGSGDPTGETSGTSGNEVTVPLSRTAAASAVRDRLRAQGPKAHGVRARSRSVVVVVP